MVFNHKHLIVDFKFDPSIYPYATHPIRTVVEFLEEAVRAVRMKIFLPARARYCDTEGNEGTTGDVVIETSHMSIHLWDKEKIGRFDLYSCQDFNEDDVCNMLADWFGAWVTKKVVLDRNP